MEKIINGQNRKVILILLSGPSGIGKGPLTKALFAYMKSQKKDVKIVKHVLYTERDKREGEVNGVTYHFVEKGSLAEKESQNFMVFGVRGKEQNQGIDFEVLRKQLGENDVVFLEIFHEYISNIKTWVDNSGLDVSVISVFLTPLSAGDFTELGCGKERKLKQIAVQAAMQTKLTNRNTEDKEKRLNRAKSAFEEIEKYTENKVAYQGNILVNHYGEDVAPLWEKLQETVSSDGLDRALKDKKLQYLAETFDEFLTVTGCK